jgi:hypothetical protein
VDEPPSASRPVIRRTLHHEAPLVGTLAQKDTRSTLYNFPDDADDIIGHLAGVVNASVHWTVFGTAPDVSAQPYPGADQAQLQVYAASPGYLRAIDPTLAAGTLFTTFHNGRQLDVAVPGPAAAARLGIRTLATQPARVGEIGLRRSLG